MSDSNSNWLRKWEQVTITKDIGEDEARQMLGELFKRLNKKTLTRKQYERLKEINRIVFFERGKSGLLHFHILLRMPEKFAKSPESLRDKVREQWTKLTPIESPSVGKCGGDPKIHDPSGEQWFIYKENGFTFDNDNAIMRYGIKNICFDGWDSVNIDCIDHHTYIDDQHL